MSTRTEEDVELTTTPKEAEKQQILKKEDKKHQPEQHYKKIKSASEDPPTDTDTDLPRNGTEIRIGVVGQVDNAKTTTISVLTHDDLLDNGNGSARQKILAHPHEQETGRTSSVTKGYLQLPDKNWMIFVDLAGHEKYLKTTMFGISGAEADYAMVVVAANQGVSKMTREHLAVVLSYHIPIYIVITKIDLVKDKEHIFQKTMTDIQKLMTRTKRYKSTLVIENMDQVSQGLDLMTQPKIDFYPIFTISNKTGENIDLLKSFVHKLPSRYHYRQQVDSGRQIFRVHTVYTVDGVGLVFSGMTAEGVIRKNDTLYLGPIYGMWTKVTVRSIHNNFRTVVSELPQGQTGCLAVRLHDKRLVLTKNRIRKGVCLADQMYSFTRRFRATVMIMSSHSTTVRRNYQPVIHCKTIQQVAQICSIIQEETVMVAESTEESEKNGQGEDSDQSRLVEKTILHSKKCIRAGDKSQVVFRFVYREEFIKPGYLFLFREGNVRGIGRIEELLPDEVPTGRLSGSQGRKFRKQVALLRKK